MKSSIDNDRFKFLEGELLGGPSNKLIQVRELARFRHSNRDFFQKLTSREKQVLAAISSGMTNDEVAAELDLSRHTVGNHRKSIKKKLEADTFTELYKFALAFELIDY
ncbi:MAG: helix-turn-helix transcriptional regulator [Balneolaceae bacterium]|nr:helix-turn-helix transcriptional regulator [Balneolaceae bacterium]